MRGLGHLPSTACATSTAFGPDTRKIPIPPRPGAVACATIVSFIKTH